MITIYIDGASIGNPGKIGIGFVMYRDKEVLLRKSVYLGIQSNNFAEYMALIFALTELLFLGEKQCKVFTDSQLLSEQINGNYKVKNKNIYPLFILAKNLIQKLESFSIVHIDREQNQEADQLAKEATGFLV